ncbi:tetratricopeptide repeat protein [Acidisphaera sp. L21]|uniref:tetratricopeptide repeat-containing glycosyltransferase family protein n=1 Tax=Acidisphaera sp. L21 TaxID=1641851 RepID=UPI00131DC2E5|nr:tetratricopeptide repeat-containing glycosyltransferase family protein [Acidisphaera sp. L21]
MDVTPLPMDVPAELALAEAELAGGLLHPALARVSAVVRHDPDHPQALGLAGKIAIFMNQPESGLAALQRAIMLNPTSDSRVWLSLCLERLGRRIEALEHLDIAVECLPQTAGAHFAIGLLLENLNCFDRAARLYLAAIALDAGHADAHHHHGRVLHALGQFDAAIGSYQAALDHGANKASVYTDLSSALSNLGRFDEANRAGEIAVAMDPDAADAQNNLAHSLLNLNRSAEAVRVYERALVLRPEYARAHFGHALALLKCGDFARGWAAYEWRWRDCQTPRTDLAVPAWRGEAIGGRTILLHAEQGLGDTLQFVRLASVVAARGGRVVLQVPRPLARLLRSVDGVAEVIASGDPLPPIDLHCPVASLPHACALRLDTIPTRPYIQVSSAENAQNGAALRRWATGPVEHSALVVGLVWAGDPRPHDPNSNLVDRRRSTTLASLAPLFDVTGVKFVSFQLGKAQQQIAGFGRPLIDGMVGVTDFVDTAARLAGTDLLISVDTSIVHLAGALGLPVWMLSRFDGCWRWLERREDSPWYPTMRIFRQSASGDWPGVVAQASDALRSMVGKLQIAA